MGIFDYIKSKWDGGTVEPTYTQTGRTAVYSQFGNNIYASEIVNQCVKRIADEVKKLTPRHIVESGDTVTVQRGSIADVLAKPNELMTLSDFLERITYQLFRSSNAWIYPTYIMTEQGKRYTGLYPLYPSQVDFGETDRGRVVVRMRFPNGGEAVLPYDEVIHWRYNFSSDEFMGGGENGQPNNESLLETLQLNKSLRAGMQKAANAPVNGVVKYGSVISEDKLQKKVEEFNRNLQDNNSGILGIDAKSEFQQLTSGVKVVDSETMTYVKKEICGHFGVSLPVLEGTATLDEKRAFYDTSIEPLIVSLNQAFTNVLLTKGQRYRGNRIAFYYGELLFMSFEQKIEFVKEVGARGALTDNQILGIFGLEPYEGGNVRRMSLNYVDVDIANTYQLNNAGADEKEVSTDDGYQEV